MRAFAPRYEDAARPHRRSVGSAQSVDEAYVKVAGAWAYVYRAIDERGQVADVYVGDLPAAEDAAAFSRRAIEATGVIPDEVTTDCAAAFPPALAAALPAIAQETGKAPQQRIGRDHQHRKGRVRGVRGFQTPAGAKAFCRAHAFRRNPRGNFQAPGTAVSAAAAPRSPGMRAWDAPTVALLGQ